MLENVAIAGMSLTTLGVIGLVGVGVIAAGVWGWQRWTAKTVTAEPGSDDKPPKAVSDWVARYMTWAPDAGPMFHLSCAREGLTKCQAIDADRKRIRGQVAGEVKA